MRARARSYFPLPSLSNVRFLLIGTLQEVDRLLSGVASVLLPPRPSYVWCIAREVKLSQEYKEKLRKTRTR